MQPTQVPNAFALGLDVGHSAVKIAMAGSQQIIKTAVCREIRISDEAEARRALEDTYDVPGKGRFFVGETALVQGVNAGDVGLSDAWIETPEYAALMMAGVRKASRLANGAQPKLIIMGLPASLYARQKATLTGIAASLFPTSRIVVMPQSYAPYTALKIDSHGNIDPAYAAMSSFGVIEVGYYTSDFAMIVNERPVERANVSCSGVRVAVEALSRMLSAENISTDMDECERALSTGTIKQFGQQRSIRTMVEAASASLVSEVVDAANRLFEANARKMDAIILAGGGAALLESSLRSKWPNLVVPDNPRFVVAEGLRRIGEARLQKAV